MNDVIRQIDLLLPHGYCFSWNPAILRVHVIADAMIALAYFSIPVALLVFVRRRRDLQFRWMFVMFGLFIMACGMTHVMGVWTIWQPVYWAEGVVKAVTAAVSIATASLLWPLLPKALALPSPADLARVNTELQAEIGRRRAAEVELLRTNEALRVQVAELEGFSYAISHDLRAPLRHIDGYGTMLQDHHGPQLDAEGRRYIGRILESVRHLGELVDGLLTFTRTGNASVNAQMVDAERLVRDVLHKLIGDKAVSDVEIDVWALPTVRADTTMLRLVFLNLIDNALKYSRGRKPARIVVGALEESGDEYTFFVRDNGVGFDPRYADKLFGVFQRLHHADEFEGTGIGLANVRRIVLKHGGRVWAEARVGVGATFYFSLKKNPSTAEGVDAPAPPQP